MPTYDYKCESCGKVFEVFHGMTEEPKVVCESCNSEDTKKQISSGAGIIYKGSGFYTTDYKKKESCSAANQCSNNSCPSAHKK